MLMSPAVLPQRDLLYEALKPFLAPEAPPGVSSVPSTSSLPALSIPKQPSYTKKATDLDLGLGLGLESVSDYYGYGAAPAPAPAPPATLRPGGPESGPSPPIENPIKVSNV